VSIPGTLVVLGTIEGGVKLERKIQHSFKDYHICGEWYKAVDSLLAYIKEFSEPASLKEKRVLDSKKYT
ncbi:hypothetical protein, partial [Mesotoga sp.]|uniref:hypothetical protein n=1 Tax=Mesotoga sp. TaxID=2053577 RepID=UPI00345F10B1